MGQTPPGEREFDPDGYGKAGGHRERGIFRDACPDPTGDFPQGVLPVDVLEDEVVAVRV